MAGARDRHFRLAKDNDRHRQGLLMEGSSTSVAIGGSRDQVRSHLRAAYEQTSAQLIASSHVIAVHFQTVASPVHGCPQRT